MSEEASFWAGEFGRIYTARNRVDWRARIPFWQEVINLTGARSVFEAGCNAGWNLTAIRRAQPDVQLHGCEINQAAHAQAQLAGLAGLHRNDAISALRCYSGGMFDLVFTAGVLIHIGPQELGRTMLAIKEASARYVLAVEYAADQDEEVEYRGHAAKLWRRPFGKMYAALGLKIVHEWVNVPGFDQCNAWLLEKQT